MLVNPDFYAALNGERLIVSHLCGVLGLYTVVDGDNQQFMLCIKFAYVFSSSCEVQILQGKVSHMQDNKLVILT